MNLSITQSPENALGILFEDVQLSTLFSDSKTFTDCIPKREYSTILSDYLFIKNTKGFDLEDFVDNNFIIPKPKNSQLLSPPPPSKNEQAEVAKDNSQKELLKTLKNYGLTIQKAKIILNGMKNSEIQYIQQRQNLVKSKDSRITQNW